MKRLRDWSQYRGGLTAEVLKYMCGGIHCGEVEGLVSIQGRSHSRGAKVHVWWNTL